MPIYLATFIAPTNGADIPMVQADRVWGGTHVVPTHASLASTAVSTTTISPNTRLAGMVAIVTADETHLGNPTSFYILAGDLTTWNYAGSLASPSLSAGSQYTFKPTANPDPAAEAALALFLASTGDAPLINLNLSLTASTYSFASPVDLKGGAFLTVFGSPVAPLTVTFTAGSSTLRNLSRVSGCLNLVLHATPGNQVLFYDSPQAVLIVEDIAVISSTGTDFACGLNAQTLTVVTATGGRLSGVVGGPVFQLTNSHAFVFATGGFGYSGPPTLNQAWLTGDPTSTLFYELDATSVYPGDPLANDSAQFMPSPGVQYSAFSVYNNVGVLGAVNASKFLTGQTEYVLSLDRTFEWSTGTLPAGVALGSTTVFPDFTGSGFWIWRPTPSYKWQSQGVWYINPLTGNDEANGLIPVTAIKTVAELARRTGGTFNQNTTVNIIGDLPSTDRPIWFLQSGDPATTFITLTVVGQEAGGFTTSTVNSFAPANPAALPAGTQASLTVNLPFGPPLGPGVYQKVECLVGVGPAVRCVGYFLSTADQIVYLTGSWADPTTGAAVAPQPGDTLNFRVPVNIQRVFTHAENVEVLYQNVKTRPFVGNESLVVDMFSGCEITGGDIGHGATFTACIITASVDSGRLQLTSGEYVFNGCTVFNAFLLNEGSTLVSSGFTFYGGSAMFGGGISTYGANSFTDFQGDNGFFNTTVNAAVNVAAGSSLQLSLGSTLFGSGNARGVIIDSGAQIVVGSGVVPNINAGGALELSIGNQTNIPPLVAGIPTGSANATTWANLTAFFVTGGKYACVDLYSGARYASANF